MKKKYISIQSGGSFNSRICSKSSDIMEKMKGIFENNEKKDKYSDKIEKKALKSKKKKRSWERIKNSKVKKEKKIIIENKNGIKNNTIKNLKKIFNDAFLPTDLNGKKIRKSMSGTETNMFGKSMISNKSINNIFDPEAMSKVKNDKFTNIILSDAKKIKNKKIQAKQRNNDWEKLPILKKNKNVPKKKTSKATCKEIESIKKISKENSIKAQRAKIIQNQMNRLFLKDFEKKAKNDKTWEQQKINEIERIQKKTYKVNAGPIKLSQDFTPVKKINVSEMKKRLRGFFDPPKEPKQTNIKRKSNISISRKKREDDRSWEVISKPKTTKL